MKLAMGSYREILIYVRLVVNRFPCSYEVESPYSGGEEEYRNILRRRESKVACVDYGAIRGTQEVEEKSRGAIPQQIADDEASLGQALAGHQEEDVEQGEAVQ